MKLIQINKEDAINPKQVIRVSLGRDGIVWVYTTELVAGETASRAADVPSAYDFKTTCKKLGLFIEMES